MLRSLGGLRPSSVSGLMCIQNLHTSVSHHLPKAAMLKLPDNMQDINASEMACFSPLRTRELCGSVLMVHQLSDKEYKIDITLNSSDPHIGSYDCRGAVNLSSSMQSNVPSPFGGQLNYLSMPGSQWGQGYKYLSDYQHNSHYLNLRNTHSRGYKTWTNSGTIGSYRGTGNSLLTRNPLGNIFIMRYADDANKPSRRQQLKRAVAEYGSTVIVFHITISLASLGGFYLLVSSGLDVTGWMETLGVGEGVKKVGSNAGTFVIAYAVHKVFAPVRIGITLTATPFIVRHLRKIGILKTPKS